jgi:hypothetical protein
MRTRLSHKQKLQSVRSGPTVICTGSETRIKIFTVRIKKLLAISTLCISALRSRSRQISARQRRQSNLRSLTQDDGLSIISAALYLRVSRAARQDCSHLVHTIYQRAGFSYPYARSSDLYRGTENFQRVDHPQADDLLVWRGRVGIVINPAQHAFFSSNAFRIGV